MQYRFTGKATIDEHSMQPDCLLVERHARYEMLVKADGVGTQTTLIRQAYKLPRECYQSLMWDRGNGMVGHRAYELHP